MMLNSITNILLIDGFPSKREENLFKVCKREKTNKQMIKQMAVEVVT